MCFIKEISNGSNDECFFRLFSDFFVFHPV